MSANTSAGNNSNNSSSSSSSTYPQQSKDGTQIIYSWLPHSTALGASSTVALRVRNASLTGAGSVNMGHFTMPPAVSSLGDETKYNEGEQLHPNPQYPECRVEASLYSMGLPLQAAPISTKYAPLLPYNDNGNGNDNASNMNNRSMHPDFANGKEWGTATFDKRISLPVRWRDLTRDACLALNVHCDGDCFSNSGNTSIMGRHRLNGIENGDLAENSSSSSSSNNIKQCASNVWGTTLPLFDENGRLRSGLYKLILYPNTMADGGMSYQSKGVSSYITDGMTEKNSSIETFLEGGATPGILGSSHQQHTRNGYSWFDGTKLENGEGEDDPKWKASLILHQLDGHVNGTSTAMPITGKSLPPLQHPANNQNPVSWLDDLTRERCLDVLHEPEDDGGYYNQSNIPSTATQTSRDRPAPTSSHHTTPYLIIELPTPPIPILHEEPLYPVETSTHLRGTTGSITANELVKFHSKFLTDDPNISGTNNSNLTTRISPLATTAPPNPANQTPQSFLYPLLQTLDHEPPLTAHEHPSHSQDNPAQDKYRILAHHLLRGLVDPGLKPDRAQRHRLERIVSSPSYHLSTEEKDLLWRFRFSLVDNRRALTKFLLAVDWSVESEVVQAAELLEQWRKRSPIEVTDALKLLGRNVAFQTSLVRSYAIETLSEAPDEELRLYLLQLVQALKYEEDDGDGASIFSQSNKGSSGSEQVSSLSAFLIERASRNIELANFLYWYLRAEMLNPVYEARYREAFQAFQTKLSSVCVNNGAIVSPKQSSQQSESTISLWQLLTEQDKFITGIMDCQQDSLVVRGKKDAKEARLKESLKAGGFHDIPHAVPLPSAPHIWVTGVDCNSAKMFKSALYPAVLDFIVDHANPNSNTAARAATKQMKLNKDEITKCKVMIKTGDDLRQDQLVIMMIQLMDRLLKRGTLDLCLRPYSILAMPNNTGLLEFVERSIPVSQILSGNNHSIMAFFQSVAPAVARHSVQPDVLQTYIRSCAGYCVLTYLLGVGDRHLDNIMIQPTGHFFHIDFGFIFGRDPKPLPPAFRLTKEMVDGMGGADSREYRQFCSLACQAFNVLRKSAGLVLNLLHLMSDAGIEDLSHNPSADAIGVISKVEERFKLELTDEQAELFFVGLIKESLSALAPRVMEMFHQLAVARR